MFRAIAGTQMLLGSLLLCAAPSLAADKMPADWQKQSLKGITAVRYGVGEPSVYNALSDVTASFASVKSPTMKSIPNVKADYANSLGVTEARVIVVADNREKNQCWVGLAVEQLSQLKRTPSITYSSETYYVGKMCPKKEVSAAVKDVCKTFAKDLAASNAK